ncbi:hypothetical protein C2S52_023429 [Perilla frutescens var. hirtella]|nr:hypothetical protein C2S52_023429 [Perilla frutescens var. hirtella]
MSLPQQRHSDDECPHIDGVTMEKRLLSLVRFEIDAGRMSTTKDVVMAMLRIAAFLTSVLGKQITGLHVARKLEQLRECFENFMWFKAVPGVHFDADINRVIILPEYWDRYESHRDEPVDFILFRLNGEPKYPLLHEVFTNGGAGKLDMQWIISRLDGGYPKWLPEPRVNWWWQP